MSLLRTRESQEKYEAFKKEGGLNNGCGLCEADSIKEFDYWRLIKNKFPYDRIAEVHDMIIPKRHIRENDLSESEKTELLEIKNGDYIGNNYHFIIEATTGVKSIPTHFHLHLTRIKE
ncbi:MAG: hypothetical protein Q8P99_00340 [bacterium]|nr:hypothetical protein [bacterium]